MKKNSAEHIPCTYCDNDALPDTNPPVCEDCKKMHKEAGENNDVDKDTVPKTLKELERC